MEFMLRKGYDPTGAVETLAEYATGSAKTVRKAAIDLLGRCRDKAIVALLARLEKGDAGETPAQARKIDDEAARKLAESVEPVKDLGLDAPVPADLADALARA